MNHHMAIPSIDVCVNNRSIGCTQQSPCSPQAFWAAHRKIITDPLHTELNHVVRSCIYVPGRSPDGLPYLKTVPGSV